MNSQVWQFKNSWVQPVTGSQMIRLCSSEGNTHHVMAKPGRCWALRHGATPHFLCNSCLATVEWNYEPLVLSSCFFMIFWLINTLKFIYLFMCYSFLVCLIYLNIASSFSFLPSSPYFSFLLMYLTHSSNWWSVFLWVLLFDYCCYTNIQMQHDESIFVAGVYTISGLTIWYWIQIRRLIPRRG